MIGKEINEFKARLADAKELFRVSVCAVENVFFVTQIHPGPLDDQSFTGFRGDMESY